jgi:SAM-dependent methyltransferase
MARRSLSSHGSFFRPFLWPGAVVLDCGCGPGTITTGIALAVAPGGSVTGIDANPEQIEQARQEPAPYANVAFEVSEIYNLPFPDGHFDAAFSHALFEHLADPVRAAREVLRVLKPGGAFGVRSPDWTGKLAAPPLAAVDAALRRYGERQAANGGDLEIGRKLGSVLGEAGFDAIRQSASYECYSPPGMIADYLARQVESEDASALRNWAGTGGAFFAQAWGEAVGRKRL